MRQKAEYMVLSFKTTTAAMAMESACGEKGIPGRMIPVPREITAGCGLAWRIPIDQFLTYEEQIEKLGIPLEGQTILFL